MFFCKSYAIDARLAAIRKQRGTHGFFLETKDKDSRGNNCEVMVWQAKLSKCYKEVIILISCSKERSEFFSIMCSKNSLDNHLKWTNQETHFRNNLLIKSLNMDVANMSKELRS